MASVPLVVTSRDGLSSALFEQEPAPMLRANHTPKERKAGAGGSLALLPGPSPVGRPEACGSAPPRRPGVQGSDRWAVPHPPYIRRTCPWAKGHTCFSPRRGIVYWPHKAGVMVAM